jgi:hypothetical protein
MCFIAFHYLAMGGMGGGCGKGDRVQAKESRFWKGSKVYKATHNVINNLIV